MTNIKKKKKKQQWQTIRRLRRDSDCEPPETDARCSNWICFLKSVCDRDSCARPFLWLNVFFLCFFYKFVFDFVWVWLIDCTVEAPWRRCSLWWPLICFQSAQTTFLNSSLVPNCTVKRAVLKSAINKTTFNTLDANPNILNLCFGPF